MSRIRGGGGWWPSHPGLASRRPGYLAHRRLDNASGVRSSRHHYGLWCCRTIPLDVGLSTISGAARGGCPDGSAGLVLLEEVREWVVEVERCSRGHAGDRDQPGQPGDGDDEEHAPQESAPAPSDRAELDDLDLGGDGVRHGHLRVFDRTRHPACIHPYPPMALKTDDSFQPLRVPQQPERSGLLTRK